MKIRKDWYKQRWVGLAMALCVAVLFYLFISHFNVIWRGLGNLYGYIRPVVIGIIIAYVINPLANVFEKRLFKKWSQGKPRTAHMTAVILALVFVGVLIALLLVALIPQLIDSIGMFFSNLDNYAASLEKLLDGLADNIEKSGQDASRLRDVSNMIVSALTSFLPKQPSEYVDMVTNVSTNVFDLVIGIIMAIYFLMDKKHLLNGCKRFLRYCMTEKHYRGLASFGTKCNEILVRYIGSDLIDGLIIGVANAVFMLIMRMPYVAIISVVVGVTNLAPTFGPIVGAVIGAVILVLVNPWYALWFLIFTLILQTMDGYVIKPKLFGNTLGVSGIWILICIIVGGKMFGVWGILLSIPFAAISDYVYHEGIMPHLKAKHQAREAKEAEKEQEEFAKRQAKEQEEDNAEMKSEDAIPGLLAYAQNTAHHNAQSRDEQSNKAEDIDK